MAEVKLTVEKSGKRVEIDTLTDEYFTPEGEPDTTQFFDDKTTKMEVDVVKK